MGPKAHPRRFLGRVRQVPASLERPRVVVERVLEPDESWEIPGGVWAGRVDGILAQPSVSSFVVVTETQEV